MNRSTFCRCLWLVPLIAALASCKTPKTPEPLDASLQPAGEPVDPELERQRQLAMLLEKINALEKGLSESRPAGASPDTSSADAAGLGSARPDTPDVRTGANSAAALHGTPSQGNPTVPPPEPLREITIGTLIEALEARSQAEPRDLKLQWQLRILYLLAGQDEKALDVMEGVPDTEQAFWRQIMWALVNYADEAHGLSESERAGEAIRALDDARSILTKQAPLEIKNLAFCSEIRGFGDLTPVVSNEFKPNQLMLLYCELEGFTVEKTEDERGYRASVRQELELLTLRGDSVWPRDFGEVEDFCRSPRRDFYFYSKFNIPERLLPGQYILKVTMTDCLGGKITEETLTIQVR